MSRPIYLVMEYTHKLATLQPCNLPSFPLLCTSVLRFRTVLTKSVSILRRVVPWIVLGGLLCGLTVGYAVLIHVPRSTVPYRYESPIGLPKKPVAIVFGAGVYGERPSRVLAERIQGAISLQVLERTQKFLFTGDNSSVNYDEVTVMQSYAIRNGIPAEEITLDYAGFSTYESCYRARTIFGVTEAILISQEFHLARAVYICRQLGVDAVGLGVSDWLYEPTGQRPRTLTIAESRYRVREFLATTKALWQLHVTKPEPTYLGPFEGLN